MKLSILAFVAMLALPAFAQTPSSDPRLDVAIARSVAALPDFDAALGKNRKAMLDVRVPYGAGLREDVWLGGVRRNADGSYDGIVLNPVAHADLTQGSFYHARRDQVANWVYEDEAGDHGGATVKLMRERDPKNIDGFHFAD